MFGIGMPEMILILAVALIVIGPKKLPDLAKSLGRAMGEFKKATTDLKDSMQIDSADIKDVKETFEDLKSDINQTVDLSMKDAEKDPDKKAPEDTGKTGEDSGEDSEKKEDSSALDALKSAFDEQDKENGGADSADTSEKNDKDAETADKDIS